MITAMIHYMPIKQRKRKKKKEKEKERKRKRKKKKEKERKKKNIKVKNIIRNNIVISNNESFLLSQFRTR